MKISLDWLSDFVTLTEKNPQVIADRITACTAEVEDVEVQGNLLEHCCVGKVLSIAKHPNADKLSLCDVQTDRGVKHIVCGGINLRVGMRVAFAHVGATVRWHGTDMMTLAKTAIRGEESEGMICAAEELDLMELFPEAQERNIIDMGDGNSDIGKSLRDALGLTDVILHIDNHAITQRPDLFSHVGFAREFVALGLARWKKIKEPRRPESPRTPILFRFRNDIVSLVPRYCSCLLTIDRLGETPAWMTRRLRATGWRPVNLPVDITNYVATEIGMPLHSFDASDLHGDVHIRLAKENEVITTLDGIERKLPEGVIVLSDDVGIFDLMGIMGGLRSSTKDTTRRIYLHSTIVDPVTIRRTILATGHRTEAATVYEKGIPQSVCLPGLLRSIDLFLKLVPGARLASRLESWGNDGKGKPIHLPLEKVSGVLGTTVSEKEIQSTLQNLGFSVSKQKAKSGKTSNQKPVTSNLVIIPPLHRLRDIEGEHDVIEEIARLHGYNTIPPVPPVAELDPPPRDNRLLTLRQSLKEQGYVEILPLSLLGPSLLRKCAMDPEEAVTIENPLGEEESLLQTSTFLGLLQHAERNAVCIEEELRTFTVARAFRKSQEEWNELSALLWKRSSASPHESPFLLLKQNIHCALGCLHLETGTMRLHAPPAFAHPGRAAELTLEDTPVGVLYEIHSIVQRRFDLPGTVAIATINLTRLLSFPPKEPVAKPLPLYPAITYDHTLSLDQRTSVGPLVANARGSHMLLESIAVRDLYEERNVGGGAYKLTVRCTYRSPERTLREEEAQAAHAHVISTLGKPA